MRNMTEEKVSMSKAYMLSVSRAFLRKFMSEHAVDVFAKIALQALFSLFVESSRLMQCNRTKVLTISRLNTRKVRGAQDIWTHL